MLITYRKSIFNQVQHFAHLNLAVALLLGLAAFVGGIQEAAEYRVRILLCMRLDLKKTIPMYYIFSIISLVQNSLFLKQVCTGYSLVL